MSLVRFPVTPQKTLVDAFYEGFAFENVLHFASESGNREIFGLKYEFYMYYSFC